MFYFFDYEFALFPVCYRFEFQHCTTFAVLKFHPFGIVCSFLALVEFLDVFTHISVKLVKVDVCQYRADYSTLWRATICFVEYPIFNKSRIEELAYQSKKTLIVNSLP